LAKKRGKVSEPNEHYRYALLDAFEEDQMQKVLMKFDFQIIHSNVDIKEIIKKAFAVNFIETIRDFGYFDYLREQTFSYIDELYGHDVPEEYRYDSIDNLQDNEIEEYILEVLIDESDIFPLIESHKVFETKYITNFTANFETLKEICSGISELENITDNFMHVFVNELRSKNEIFHLIKFKDDLRQNKYMEYYNEIYILEMELRKVLSYIFNAKYDEPYKLLGDYDIKLRDNSRGKQDYINTFENEFFMFCFSDYTKICAGEVKGSTSNKELIDFIKSSFSFDEFKQKLELGISDQKHSDFLASIVKDLDSIERVRNAIMHCRAIPIDIENYEKSKMQLKLKIDMFWKNIKLDEQNIQESSI
jgi:hypothetical protein